jgi:DNA-binding GntR family transcriptional regulator
MVLAVNIVDPPCCNYLIDRLCSGVISPLRGSGARLVRNYSNKELAISQIFDYKFVITNKDAPMPVRPNLGLVRIARETVQERVYCALRDQLMRGGFEPGQKLKIAELAQAFGTSAMPVRDALNRLTVERALETLPSRTVRVPALSKDALQDLRETRFAIEGLAISRAASNMTAESLATLERLIVAQSETDEEHVSEESAEQNRAFHFAIYRQSGSTVLLPIIESLWLQFGPYLREASERFDGGDGRGTNFHREMLDALSRGDGIAARGALEADIGRAFDLVMSDESLWQRRDGVA